MPLVRISLLRGKSRAYRSAIADNVYEALRESFNVPEDDRFMVITEHDPQELVFSRSYMGMQRTDDFVLIQLTVSKRVPRRRRMHSIHASWNACNRTPGSGRMT